MIVCDNLWCFNWNIISSFQSNTLLLVLCLFLDKTRRLNKVRCLLSPWPIFTLSARCWGLKISHRNNPTQFPPYSQKHTPHSWVWSFNEHLIERTQILNVKCRWNLCFYLGPIIRVCLWKDRMRWGRLDCLHFPSPHSPIGSFVFYILQGVASIYSICNTVMLSWCQWMWFQYRALYLATLLMWTIKAYERSCDLLHFCVSWWWRNEGPFRLHSG